MNIDTQHTTSDTVLHADPLSSNGSTYGATSAFGTASGTDAESLGCHGATRRHALIGLAAAAGALCAGCSSSSSKASGTPTTSQPGAATTAGTTSSPASSDASSGAASSSGSASAGGSASSSGSASGSSSAAGGGGTPLAAVSSVPVGGGTILADKQIVLTQPTAGDIKAFSAVCTHQGCTVASVANGLITCPCHGSQYKITDGSVAAGPAPRPLDAKRVKVENGQVLLAS